MAAEYGPKIMAREIVVPLFTLVYQYSMMSRDIITKCIPKKEGQLSIANFPI